MKSDPSCIVCKHVHTSWLTCDAFPKGIPLIIQSGDVGHFESMLGDNGIVFEFAEGIEPIDETRVPQQ